MDIVSMIMNQLGNNDTMSSVAKRANTDTSTVRRKSFKWVYPLDYGRLEQADVKRYESTQKNLLAVLQSMQMTIPKI